MKEYKDCDYLIAYCYPIKEAHTSLCKYYNINENLNYKDDDCLVRVNFIDEYNNYYNLNSIDRKFFKTLKVNNEYFDKNILKKRKSIY